MTEVVQSAEASPSVSTQSLEPAHLTSAGADQEAVPSNQPVVPAQETQIPEKYEIKLPDGSPLDQARLDTVSSIARDLKLSNEQAQALANGTDKLLKSYVEQSQLAQEKSVADWRESAMADKEFGGQAISQNLDVAKRAVDRFAGPELKTMLEESGYGNHPEVIRLFYRLGKQISDDTLVRPGGPNAGQKSALERMYGNKQG